MAVLADEVLMGNLRWCPQRRLEPFAVLYLIVYAIGYPVFVGVLIYRNRVSIMEDQLLVAKGVTGVCPRMLWLLLNVSAP